MGVEWALRITIDFKHFWKPLKRRHGSESPNWTIQVECSVAFLSEIGKILQQKCVNRSYSVYLKNGGSAWISLF
jgi:hypothetical protein